MDGFWEFLLALNWGAFGGLASFIFSLFGAWFGWYSFILKGSKVKLKAKLVVQTDGAVLDADLNNKEDFPFEFLDEKSTPVLYVRARNSGRSPIDIESLEIVSSLGASKPFVSGGIDQGHSLPHRLESGSSGNWMFNVQSAIDVLEHKGGKPKNALRAVVKLANDKTVRSDSISNQELKDYRLAWKRLFK